MPLQADLRSRVKVLDISQVAKRSGVAASRLRYYEERGLLASIGRRGLRRIYEPQVLQQLALISLGQAAGFSLDEIATMFGLDGKPDIDRDMLKKKAGELDRTIRRLAALRDGLRHAAACPEERHGECPTFQRLLNLAATSERQRAVMKRGPRKHCGLPFS